VVEVAPFVVSIIGKKNSGKTTLTVGLVAELVKRGHRVMTVKHGHGFTVDREGTDSWRHRHDGGAERVVMVGPHDLAMVGGWGPEGEIELMDIVRSYLSDAEIVVAEGYKMGDHPKVEVYRSAAHAQPIYYPDHPGADTFLAVVTDREDFLACVPVLSLTDATHVRDVADLIEAAAKH
jgi:molybdopterin-guanine dinucleotide biosynthesis protein B